MIDKADGPQKPRKSLTLTRKLRVRWGLPVDPIQSTVNVLLPLRYRRSFSDKAKGPHFPCKQRKRGPRHMAVTVGFEPIVGLVDCSPVQYRWIGAQARQFEAWM